MKRMMLNETDVVGKFSVDGADIPDDIAAYAAQLKLLYSVPFSWLVVREEFLPAESMRFFCLDENWTNALVDGALSIGRSDSAAACRDKAAFGPVVGRAGEEIGRIRYEKIHENHRSDRALLNFAGKEDCRSGFLIRSALVRRWKGLEVTGYGTADRALTMLRADRIGTDILICIFDGKPGRVEISEPKTGLRFGAYENDRVIQVKNVEEGETFGTYLPGKEVKLQADENGRLQVKKVAAALKDTLGREITPSLFAFELMLAAQKAVFCRKGEQE